MGLPAVILDYVSFLSPLKNLPLYARLFLKSSMVFLAVWIIELGLLAIGAPPYIWITERVLIVICMIFALQKDVFERIRSALRIQENSAPPLTFKIRLRLLIGPFGTWCALSLVLWSALNIAPYVASKTPLLISQALWLLMFINTLVLLLLVPRLFAFYPLLRYLKHPHPFRHAYHLSRTWRFYLLLFILSPLLVGDFLLITKLPEPTSWAWTAPLFVPLTAFVFLTNMTCLALLCLSLVREELSQKEQEERNNPFISGRTASSKAPDFSSHKKSTIIQ